ncbi:MAG: Eco57I restriction-modification methylase domain-containing protein [Ignavibacteriaceae bacterium]
MTEKDIKINIQQAIETFANTDAASASEKLLHTLGYKSTKKANVNLDSLKKRAAEKNLSDVSYALWDEWKNAKLIFQYSDDEVKKQSSLFEVGYNDTMQSYLFFSVELNGEEYSRSQVSNITRFINRLYDIPVMLFFRYGNLLTVSVINRRPDKKDTSKDVLEKVTQIKDINIASAHRAHIDILFDLSFDELKEKHQFTNFVELHNSWQKTLDTKELNKKFFKELANWYFWAMDNVQFPDDIEKKKEVRNATNLIRLITRIIFIWFIKEKKLVPANLFRKDFLVKTVKDFAKDKKSENYYQAILQNLFFGTLNQLIDKRELAETHKGFVKGDQGVRNIYRFPEKFLIPEDEVKKLFKDVPFLNGGLFDCLDKTDDETKKDFFVDGFTRREDKQASVPDYLFFGEETEADLTSYYDPAAKKPILKKVKGLVILLESYKFTVAENTPIEEEIALDPELLGKVFENLLASYNPETQTTARKQTGSFYTPREIVNYMVDESLMEYLKQKCKGFPDLENRLRDLLSYSENPNPFNEKETKILIKAINNCKMLDPACGSGAFPMGMLHKMVHILTKLDPDNNKWKAEQEEKIIGDKIKELEKDKNAIEGLSDAAVKEKARKAVDDRLKEIKEIFESENNFDDYSRKLFLIENCIYGVDIQPIAVQITKLRFFISLIIDQNKQEDKENLGIRSLPNLETKFVAANTLIDLDKPAQGMFRNLEIEEKEKQLRDLRHSYFTAKTRKEKMQYQTQDKKLRKEIAKLLEDDGWNTTVAKQIVAFDPYDQNASASFFESEWMFGLTDGFDVVIGNPPYISYYSKQSHELDKEIGQYLRTNYMFLKEKSSKLRINSAMFFLEEGMNMLKKNSCLCYIVDFNLLENPFLAIRKHLTNHFQIQEVISDLVAFENVASGQIILRLKKNQTSDNEIIFKKGFENSVIKSLSQNSINEQNNYSWTVFKSNLISEIEKNSVNLETLLEIHTGVAVNATEEGKKYFIRNIHVKDSFPFLTGGDSVSSSYCNPSWDKYLLYKKEKERELNDEFDKNYYKEKGSHQRPFNLRQKEEYDRPKIFLRQSDIKFTGTYIEEMLFGNYSLFNLYNKKNNIRLLKYVLALLNSKLLSYYGVQKEIILIKPGKTPQIRSGQRGPIGIRQLPIKSLENISNFVAIVDYIMLLKIENKDSTFFERLIDAMVYELYLPEAMQKANCEVLKYLNNLPELKEGEAENLPAGKSGNLKTIDKVYKELSDPKHPVSSALLRMINIEEIEIIESKK